MNRKISTILFIAFIVAAATSYLAYRISQNQMQKQAAQPQMTQVFVAARDLEIGTLVRDADLTTAQWVGVPPKGSLPNKDSIVGRGVVAQVYQGEPVLETRLAAVGSGGGMAATIRPGMRACAVRVDDVVGVAGFVLPGMRVDVIVSGSGPGVSASDGPKVKTLLQNIEVLSAGSNIQKDTEGKPVQVQVVNLLVTPEQAEMLSLASNQTKIQLVLRNPLDTDEPKTPGMAMASIFSDGAPKPPPKVEVAVKKAPVAPPPPPAPAPAVKPPDPPPPFLIQVMNGSKHSEEKFKSPDPQ